MNQVVFFIPELIILAAILGILVSEITFHGARYRFLSGIALLALVAAFLETFLTIPFISEKPDLGLFYADSLSILFKLVFLSLGIIGVFLSFLSEKVMQTRKCEYLIFLLSIVLGFCLISSTLHLMVLFVGLQLIHLAIYYASGALKNQLRSSEAAIKYLFFSSITTSLFVFGASLLFQEVHSFHLIEMSEYLSQNGLSAGAQKTSFIFLFFALSFLIGILPIYLWVPDVLEGIPSTVGFLVAAGVPIAGFVLSIRIFSLIFSEPVGAEGLYAPLEGLQWKDALGVFCGLSMVLGSLLAFRQKSFQRTLAYLLISQSGLLGLGLIVLSPKSVSGVLYSLLIHLFSLGGIYAIVVLLENRFSRAQATYEGLARKALLEGLGLLVFFASFIGIPPFPGFIGKFVILSAAVHSEWFALGVVSLVCFLLNFATFVQFSGRVFREQVSPELSSEPAQERPKDRVRWRVLIGSVAVPIFLLWIFSDWVLIWSTQAFKQHRLSGAYTQVTQNSP